MNTSDEITKEVPLSGRACKRGHWDLYAMPPDLCDECEKRLECRHSSFGTEMIVYECPEVGKHERD